MSTTIGTFVKFTLGTKNLTGELSSSLSLSRDTIDIASKETGDWAAFVPGRGSGSFSVESVADWSETTGTKNDLKTLIDGMNNKTKFAYTVTEYDSTTGVEVVGALKITGNGYITSLEASNPDNEKAGYSISVQMSDEPVTSVNTED